MAKKRKSRAQRQKQKRIVLIAALIAVLLIAGWIVYSYIQANRIEYRDENDPVATITLQNGKKIVVELYPDKAPNTVANFVELANSGFYDGLTFHRVIKDFMIQGGDPKGDGTGGPGYSIKGEFTGNGFKNDLKHKRGVLSMARTMMPNSAGSQFFIMHEDAPHLDGGYAAFGKVTEGMEVVDRIAAVRTGANDRPLEPQVMKKVTVDTFGEEYPEPKHYS